MITEASILPLQDFYLVDGHKISAAVLNEEPLIVKFDNVVTEEECVQLIQLANNRLQRSKLANKAISEIRTSSGMFFEENENPFIAQIEQRIASLMHIPINHAEGLQILHYSPGQQFKAHFDYFSVDYPSSTNNRISTLVIYLNEVEEGGETTFPALNISVKPKQGAAVYFEYFYQDDQINEKTLHSGEPVIRGEKWVATQWMRKQVFR